jgi:hypothetical protein
MNLPSLSRADRLLLGIVLVGAALVALVTWLLESPEKTGGVLEEPSTFYNAGYGTKAAYEVLERLGFSVTRLRRPIVAETLEGIGTLVILEPAPVRDHVISQLPAYRSYELTTLENWIKAGHALVVVPGGGRFGAELSDWFRVRRAEKEAEASSPAHERRTG